MIAQMPLKILNSTLLDVFPEVGLLGRIEGLVLIFQGIFTLFSTPAAPLHTLPTPAGLCFSVPAILTGPRYPCTSLHLYLPDNQGC